MTGFLTPQSCKSIRQVFFCLPWLYHQVNSSHESAESSLLQTLPCVRAAHDSGLIFKTSLLQLSQRFKMELRSHWTWEMMGENLAAKG